MLFDFQIIIHVEHVFSTLSIIISSFRQPNDGVSPQLVEWHWNCGFSFGWTSAARSQQQSTGWSSSWICENSRRPRTDSCFTYLSSSRSHSNMTMRKWRSCRYRHQQQNERHQKWPQPKVRRDRSECWNRWMEGRFTWKKKISDTWLCSKIWPKVRIIEDVEIRFWENGKLQFRFIHTFSNDLPVFSCLALQMNFHAKKTHLQTCPDPPTVQFLCRFAHPRKWWMRLCCGAGPWTRRASSSSASSPIHCLTNCSTWSIPAFFLNSLNWVNGPAGWTDDTLKNAK